MKGFLSFLILWLLSKKAMSGSEIACEIERRKGSKPTPGTIYPALQDLAKHKLIAIKRVEKKKKVYALTPLGQQALEQSVNHFFRMFYDVLKR